MHNHHPQATRRDHENTFVSVQRLELLIRSFSADEIQRLSLLQMQHQHQPSMLDLPLDECRLRFACWLVEHGRVSESLETCPGGDQVTARALDTFQLRESICTTSRRSSSHDCPVEPHVENARRPAGARWHLVLLDAWSLIRRGAARVAALGSELRRLDYLSDEEWSWEPPWEMYGPDDPYSPRGPLTDARLRAYFPWPTEPWSWQRFRHGGYY